jgi:hypothetical protein
MSKTMNDRKILAAGSFSMTKNWLRTEISSFLTFTMAEQQKYLNEFSQ